MRGGNRRHHGEGVTPVSVPVLLLLLLPPRGEGRRSDALEQSYRYQYRRTVEEGGPVGGGAVRSLPLRPPRAGPIAPPPSSQLIVAAAVVAALHVGRRWLSVSNWLVILVGLRSRLSNSSAGAKTLSLARRERYVILFELMSIYIFVRCNWGVGVQLAGVLQGKGVAIG